MIWRLRSLLSVQIIVISSEWHFVTLSNTWHNAHSFFMDSFQPQWTYISAVCLTFKLDMQSVIQFKALTNNSHKNENKICKKNTEHVIGLLRISHNAILLTNGSIIVMYRVCHNDLAMHAGIPSTSPFVYQFDCCICNHDCNIFRGTNSDYWTCNEMCFMEVVKIFSRIFISCLFYNNLPIASFSSSDGRPLVAVASDFWRITTSVEDVLPVIWHKRHILR